MSQRRLIPGMVSLVLVSFCLACNPTAESPVLDDRWVDPTLSLDEMVTDSVDIQNFDDLHSPVNGDDNEYLIFGALPVIENPESLPADLSAFIGRWEGYGFAPPVKRDWKLVFQISEINEQGGQLYSWMGTNLQYPNFVTENVFRVVREKGIPSIQFRMTWIDGSQRTIIFSVDENTKSLRGEAVLTLTGTQVDTYELSRSRTFYVYKNYAEYLAGKNIIVESWNEKKLEAFSRGYMVYLPEGYTKEAQKQWPLILFLHGSGDRGDNIFLLAKASPFMYIREKGPLPAIIVAPLLKSNSAYQLFPDEFLEGALDEILSQYRVDKKRVTLTGLSLGGEATYRLAILRPDVFAAISPLCAFLLDQNIQEINKIKDIPVWAIHGADDQAVNPAWGKKPVDALKEAGGNIKFSLLPDHDHDVWTDTYSDPAFYEWMLSKSR